MSRWFRVYDDVINDPKILKLPEESRWHWIALLCVASKNDGALPSTEDVAISLRVKTSAAAAIIAGLKSAGLLDLVDGRYVPHNWNGRQFKSDVSNERVKRFRDRQRNVTETVTVTPPETEADTEQKQKKKETREAALSSDFEFEDFWNLWPNKVGKPAALKAFAGARKRAGLDAIVEGVFAYIRDKPPDRAWLNPATFLNQSRWEDQPAKVQHGRTQETRQSLPEAASRAGLMFACYRKAEASDPEIYAAAVAAVLNDYPTEVIDYITDPRTGLPSKSQWLPSVFEVRRACEEHQDYLRKVELVRAKRAASGR
jgi:hypothetical protein